MAKWNNKKVKQLRNNPSKYPWDDLRFPLTGARLDITAGRLDYDFFNGGVGFAANARFPEEPVSMLAQMPHEWLVGDEIKVHHHWPQEAAGGNWLLAWKKYINGETCNVDTDFTTTHTLAAGTELFTYTSGTMYQITDFGGIDMSDMGPSDCLHLVLFRDSANTSTLFSGTDATGVRISCELDIHYRKRGSNGTSNYLGSYFEYQHLGKDYENQYGKDV